MKKKERDLKTEMDKLEDEKEIQDKEIAIVENFNEMRSKLNIANVGVTDMRRNCRNDIAKIKKDVQDKITNQVIEIEVNESQRRTKKHSCQNNLYELKKEEKKIE